MDRSAASGRWEAAKVDSVVLLFSKITDLHALPTLLQRLSPSEQVCGIATCNQPEYDLHAQRRNPFVACDGALAFVCGRMHTPDSLKRA